MLLISAFGLLLIACSAAVEDSPKASSQVLDKQFTEIKEELALVDSFIETAHATDNSEIAEAMESLKDLVDQAHEKMADIETMMFESDTEAVEAYEAEKGAALEKQTELKAMMEVEKTRIKSGTFAGAGGRYQVAGGVEIFEEGENILISLGEDFESTNGPDLYLVLSQEQKLGKGGLQKDKIKIIKPLLSETGSQIYQVSKTDWENYHHSVTVWCQKFNVHFGSAILE